MKEYRAFLSKGTELPENSEVEIQIMDPDTMAYTNVRATVSRSFEGLPEADKLWLCEKSSYDKGGAVLLDEQPWAIRIEEEIEEEVEEVKVLPKQEISLGRMRGTMLETLIRRREEREKKGEE